MSVSAIGGRKYPQANFYEAVGDVIVWRVQGSGGATPSTATHKRLYHNWYFYDGLGDVVVWQQAGTTSSAAEESNPKNWITRGQSFGRFSRHKGYSR